MPADKPVISRLTASARFATRKRTHVRTRNHRLKIDDATERGGTDIVPNPPETMLASLAGCLNIQVNRLANERGIELHGVEIFIDADFCRRAVTWGGDVAIPFPLVRVSLTGRSDGSTRKLAAVRRDVLMQCPVSRLMIEGGTNFRQSWKMDKI